jgi:aminopeptidase
MDVFMKRAAAGALRWTGTQFPMQAAAQDAEMSLGEYEDFVFSAGKLDHPDPAAEWRKLSERQQRLVDFLDGKADYRVVAANGTDVRMSVAGKKWINCDGHENFPDGEVFTGPVLDSVNGVIAFSFPAVHHGRECDGVRLTFKDGKVVDASANKGEDFLISMLDTDAGSRFLGRVRDRHQLRHHPLHPQHAVRREDRRHGALRRRRRLPRDRQHQLERACTGTWWSTYGTAGTSRSTG